MISFTLRWPARCISIGVAMPRLTQNRPSGCRTGRKRGRRLLALDGDLGHPRGRAPQSDRTNAAFIDGVFFETAGYAAYTDALGQSDVALQRSIGVGVTLRPFSILAGRSISLGLPFRLTIDGIGFDLGVLWAAGPDGAFADRPGMEAALGTEVPLLGHASGPFVGVRGALRWGPDELASHREDGLRPALFFTLAWHTLVDAHIVDVGDRRML
jgi:hypothetical protein